MFNTTLLIKITTH